MGTYVYFDETLEPQIKGVDQELMATIDRARHRAGITMIPTSGVRSEAQNEAVGGVKDSAHVTGHALDIRLQDSFQLFKFLEALLHEGIQRIVIGIKLNPGSERGFDYWNLHIDNSPILPSPRLAIKIYGRNA